VLAPDLSLGESVAVNGVCLTVTGIDGDVLHADIGPETARVTTLGALRPDQPVNLERSMRTGDRFGGHFVQGHVDGVGTVENVRTDGDAHWLTIAFPAGLAPFFILKGSVAIDGISLTVAALRERQFDVMIIPFTWMHTNLSSVRLGDRVNLECDMVGKYVARALELEKVKGQMAKVKGEAEGVGP
jgi:riboflavin synthase